ncbi:MAG: hypothetical protein ABIJ12_08475 [bacterium]
MIIKSFKAKTASEAMKQIRHEMGDEAIVLKTLQMQNQVEITACIENATVSRAGDILNSKPEPSFADASVSEIKVEKNRLEQVQSIEQVKPANVNINTNNITNTKVKEVAPEIRSTSLSEINNKLNKLLSLNLHFDEDKTYSEILKPLVAQMQRADLPHDFIYHFFLNRSEKMAGKKDIQKYVVEELANVFSDSISPEINIRKGEGVLFYGPAGSGKSSMLGKLAASLITKKKNKVKLASLDDQKIGAYEELAVYADLLQLETINTKAQENVNQNDHITLIDTPAFPVNNELQNDFCDTVNRINPEYRIAVISALTRTDDVLEISDQLSKLNPTHLAVTMLDLTNRLGGIIAATRVLNTKLLFVTDAPGGVKQIMTPNPDHLAKAIMGMEVSYE